MKETAGRVSRDSSRPTSARRANVGHRALGNQNMQSLLDARIVQAKLHVSQPGDTYEREADRVAEQVMRMPAASCGGSCPTCQGPKSPMVQRRAAHDEPGGGATIADNFARDLGPGRLLDSETRAFFEPRFGRDFGGVRVHADTRAAQSARAVDAKAYTVGSHVMFGERQYAPHTSSGRRLFAHELAHVAQQTSDPADGVRSEHAMTSRAPVHVARQSEPKPADAEVDDAPVDVMAGAMVSEIVVGLANGRVAFKTSKGVVLGKLGFNDLDAGNYTIKPDVKHRKWIITKKGIETGLRFSVGLDGADPWTLAYPPTLTLTVGGGDLLTEKEAAALAAAEEKEQAELRQEIEAVKPMQVREQWAEKKDAFLTVATDPKNNLSGHQMYQIWLRLWMGRQAKAHADLEALENSLKAQAKAQGGDALAVFFANKTWFDKGKRDALGPEYRAAVERRETIDFVISYLKDVHDWLEMWVDVGGHHVTLQRVNEKALEIARAKAWFQMYMAPIILGFIAVSAGPRGEPSGGVARAVVEEPAVKLETETVAPEVVDEPVKPSESATNVTPIEEGRIIRARKGARATQPPAEAEQKLASGDRPRASSGRGRGKGGVSEGSTEERVAPRQRTESSGKGSVNIPPDEPAAEVDWKSRGAAIEQAHLDSMPEYSRPAEGNFPGIDAWKAPKSDSTRTLPNGKRVRTVSGADVLQVKSVGSSKHSYIKSNVSKGIANLESQPYQNPSGTLRVVKPRSLTLDVLFEEGVMPSEPDAATKRFLRQESARAGAKGIHVRWFRYSVGQKIVITLK